MKELNVLSVFDGMSCAMIALIRAGLKIKKYYASEIDKPAMEVSKRNWPDIVQLGDVRSIRGGQLGWIDLFVGGSPCQGFSFMGKQLNFEDPRSKLFFEYVRILKELKEVNPDILFFLENVKMKKEYQDIITKELGVVPVEINSALVSAQNRRRLYWTNIEGELIDAFGGRSIPQPKDKKIFIADILEKEVDEKYFLTEASLKRLDGLRVDFEDQEIGIVNDRGDERRVLKSTCIDANYWKGLDNHGQRTFIKIREATKKGFIEVNAGECFDATMPKSKTRRGRKMAEKSNCLIANSQEFLQFTDTRRIRRLTPVECERLQTVPDGYTAGVSDTQRYKMLGNGWNVDTIVHIFKFIK